MPEKYVKKVYRNIWEGLKHTFLIGLAILAIAYWVYIIIWTGSIELKVIATLVIWGSYIITIIGLSLK